ncbi:MAG: glycosyltransferase [Bacteroidota bacterium]
MSYFTKATNQLLYKEENIFTFINTGANSAVNSIRSKKIENKNQKPEILFITSYPPRECGIATYSYDLIKALNSKFSKSFSLRVCALETVNEKHIYPGEVIYTLNTENAGAYVEMADTINNNNQIEIVLIQHEFGFFYKHESNFTELIKLITKPVVLVLHTVLPRPDEAFRLQFVNIIAACNSVVVMTNNSSQILINDYQVPKEKINVIAHGTHLVQHLDKLSLKEKYNLSGRKVFSTFGLLSAGKSIETTLEALPAIINNNTDALFLVIGKTHPNVVKNEGEKYRNMLLQKVEELQLQDHVRFINQYLPLSELLEYLQLTDIYLFTSKDRNQAVSGTFSYAISCGCPIISTPIPHAREVLNNDAGIIVDFENAEELSNAVNLLLEDNELRENMSSNGLHKIVSTAWENVAIAHALLFEKISDEKISLKYSLPPINPDHINEMTTSVGMIQFSKMNNPDITSGYTLDDNARAMIAMCMNYELTGDESDLKAIKIYLDFIKYCQQKEGYFLNYVDSDEEFTEQNNETNLADSNGRALWALGFLISKSDVLPEEVIMEAEEIMQRAMLPIDRIHSTRAMAFAIKGLYYYNKKNKSIVITLLIETLADRLVQMYKHESEKEWCWYESYLTYANAILPEALLCAYLETRNLIYKDIARSSFDFLLSQTFNKEGIKLISNKSWLYKGKEVEHFGEQPIDVAYTILALSRFYEVFGNAEYLHKMETAFNWFLGSNHLHQIIYNPCTGGCYDGLEENHINLNQGAESTVSYLLSRLTVGPYFNQEKISSLLNKEIDFHELV